MFFKQVGALVMMAIGGIPQRLGSFLVIATGVACAVSVLVAMLSIGAGIEAMTMKHAREDRIIVMGAAGSMAAKIARTELDIIASLPGIKPDVDGKPLLSPELLVTVPTLRKKDNLQAKVSIMGVGPKFIRVFPELHITDGRTFQPGLHEVIAGKSAQTSYSNLEIGDHLSFQGAQWQVVGTFDTGGGLADTWLLTDADTLGSAVHRNGYDQVSLLLDSAGISHRFVAALNNYHALNLQAQPEPAVRKRQSRGLNGMVNFLSYVVGSIMALGAMMGALNSMYSIMDARQREFATLRALGFHQGAVVLAGVVEVLLLALPGAIVGILIAWAVFNGSTVSYLDLNFPLLIDPELFALGLAWALGVASIGGLLPSIRAARAPIATALRAN